MCAQQHQKPNPASPLTQPAAIAAAIGLVVAVVFSRALFNGFIEPYDDTEYVTGNALVQGGLTWAGFAGAFTQIVFHNWQPLTLLSHMADVSLFGLAPIGHHATSVLIHAVNAALVFLVLFRLTGERMCSAAVAVLFAIHPVQVQAVAFVASRKDVLSTLFILIAIVFYTRYAARPNRRDMIGVMVWFVMGLLAKPTVVTLPMLLVIIDVWPLNRLNVWDRGSWRRVVVEKTPLWAVSLVWSVITYAVHAYSGDVTFGERTNALQRLQAAADAYVMYVWNLVWPSNLAAHYPYPLGIPVTRTVIDVGLILLVTAAAVWTFRRRPYVANGWGWYLVALLPVIGILGQVGGQAMADRWMYVPSIGLFMVFAWGVRDVVRAFPKARLAAAAAAPVLAVVMITATWIEIGYWTNAETLWKRAIQSRPGNDHALFFLGEHLIAHGRFAEAVDALQAASEIHPKPVYYIKAATCLGNLGRMDEATAMAKKAVDLDPKNADARFLLGGAYVAMRQFDRADEAFDQITDPGPDMRNLMGVAFRDAAEYGLAEKYFERALEEDPRDARALVNLGILSELRKDSHKALEFYKQAAELDPNAAPGLADRIEALSGQSVDSR
ncbi:MAG: hypothetical protein AMXMBFR84_07230 [Candidatus Hydrogenedentota bacterium]